MSIGSNSVEFRRVRKRYVEPGGGVNWLETWQVRTKNITSSVLGLIPLSSSWSAWSDIETEGLTYVDEYGDPI